EAGDRTLPNGLALSQDVHHKSRETRPELIDVERVGGGGDEPDARRDLRRESADEQHDQQPEKQCGQNVNLYHCFRASMRAGTISKRSPTMPKSATSKMGASASLLIATM